jgi:hypothetical protein
VHEQNTRVCHACSLPTHGCDIPQQAKSRSSDFSQHYSITAGQPDATVLAKQT